MRDRVFLFSLLIILTSCGHLFYFPSEQQFYNPKKFGLEYEEHWVNTSDGEKLYGWLFRPKGKQQPKGTVVFFHGNGENISTHFIALAWLAKHNYEVFIMDYRGYWKSSGEPGQAGTYIDALASIDYAHQLHQKSKSEKFIVYCQSLGGIICARALIDSPKLTDVDALVLDSTFASYEDIAFDRLKAGWLTYIFSPLAYVLISDEYASEAVLPKYQLPVLVVHGSGDGIIPMKFGKEIFSLLKTPKKKFWEIPGGRHIMTFHSVKNQEYFLEYLNKI